MKKNKMMRIASVLLIVTILSTCAISGTFAKYVTSAEGGDGARVAKWGITIETSGSMFQNSYASTDDGYIQAFGQGALSVKADNDDDLVVAPGTTSNVNGEHALVAVVSGKPEVATRFSLKLCNLTDILLPNGTYTDYTVALTDPAETFDLDVDTRDLAPSMNNNYWNGYAPVKWDVTVTKTTTGTTANLVEIAQDVARTMGLADFATAFVTNDGVSITDAKTIVKEVERLQLKDTLINKIKETYRSLDIGDLTLDVNATTGDVYVSLDFAPLQEVNYEFVVDWTWAFEQEAPARITNQDLRDAYTALFDKCDTYLGNVAAGIVTEANDAQTELNFEFVASATQID